MNSMFVGWFVCLGSLLEVLLQFQMYCKCDLVQNSQKGVAVLVLFFQWGHVDGKELHTLGHVCGVTGLMYLFNFIDSTSFCFLDSRLNNSAQTSLTMSFRCFGKFDIFIRHVIQCTFKRLSHIQCWALTKILVN